MERYSTPCELPKYKLCGKPEQPEKMKKDCENYFRDCKRQVKDSKLSGAIGELINLQTDAKQIQGKMDKTAKQKTKSVESPAVHWVFVTLLTMCGIFFVINWAFMKWIRTRKRPEYVIGHNPVYRRLKLARQEAKEMKRIRSSERQLRGLGSEFDEE